MIAVDMHHTRVQLSGIKAGYETSIPPALCFLNCDPMQASHGVSRGGQGVCCGLVPWAGFAPTISGACPHVPFVSLGSRLRAR